MDENQFKEITQPKIVAPDVNPAARNSHARLKGAGYATASELSTYLRISLRSVPDVLSNYGVKTNRAKRTFWSEVWQKLWNIPDVPTVYHDVMRTPLLTIEDVADRVGVSARSILRDGDRTESLYGLPRNILLSPRRRRYHPQMIYLWEMDLPLEEWMRAVKRPRAGLKPRLNRNYPP